MSQRRKKSPAVEQERHNIIIHEKNPLKKIVNDVLEFLLDNRKVTLGIIIGVFLIGGATLGFYVWYDITVTKYADKLSVIIDHYNEAQSTGGNVEPVIKDLKKLSLEAPVGFPAKMSHYYLGNIYFSQKKFDDAEKELKIFLESPVSDTFELLAQYKRALTFENMGKLDEAVKILMDLNENKAGSIISDQVLFSLGRIAVKKGKPASAKTFYNNLLTNYSDSGLAQFARKRLLFITTGK
jgi:predicted negative regulator of RcsB-dependent stress response